MTHYEELGVSPDAPAEEIRRAFRRTSRLLHPDLQSVPELRQAAEVQMRRLNEVVEMLCQPESRAAYDRSLGERRLPPAIAPIPPSAHTPHSNTVHPSLIAGLAFGALAMFCWNIVSSAPTLVESTDRASAAPAQPLVPESSTRRDPSRSSSKALRSAPHETVSSVPTSPSLPISSISPATQPIPEITQPPIQTAGLEPPSAPAVPSPAPTKPLEGVWLLFRDPNEKLGPSDFAAEFIELRLQQNGEKFTGVYRSRYRIPDRVSSPDVNFRFEGTIHAQEFTWAGRGGSQGKIRLTHNGADTLNIEWVAEARIPGSLLSEGSAKLVRLRTD